MLPSDGLTKGNITSTANIENGLVRGACCINDKAAAQIYCCFSTLASTCPDILLLLYRFSRVRGELDHDL